MNYNVHFKTYKLVALLIVLFTLSGLIIWWLKVGLIFLLLIIALWIIYLTERQPCSIKLKVCSFISLIPIIYAIYFANKYVGQNPIGYYLKGDRIDIRNVKTQGLSEDRLVERMGNEIYKVYLDAKNNENLASGLSLFILISSGGIVFLHLSISKRNIKTNSNMSNRNGLPTVVILTAIKEEYLAVTKHLPDRVDHIQNSSHYQKSIFKYNNKAIANVVIRLCGQTNLAAARETERAIQYFKPNMMLFVGIAGSWKPSDFKVGDVIFADKIYYYEGGKAFEGETKAKPDCVSTSFHLLEKAQNEGAKEEWKAFLIDKYPNEVKASIGNIASGEKLVEHRYSEIGKYLDLHYNDTHAIEMEGFGFAKTTTKQGLESQDMLVGVVRGISDIIEKSQNSYYTENDTRPEEVKLFASATAAAFAFWLIAKNYEQK